MSLDYLKATKSLFNTMMFHFLRDLRGNSESPKTLSEFETDFWSFVPQAIEPLSSCETWVLTNGTLGVI